MTPLLPPQDPGPAGRVLPEWAERLSRSCTRYIFTTQQVYEGRSVMARRISGTGPDVNITRSEEEMKAALGLKADPAPTATLTTPATPARLES